MCRRVSFSKLSEKVDFGMLGCSSEMKTMGLDEDSTGSFFLRGLGGESSESSDFLAEHSFSVESSDLKYLINLSSFCSHSPFPFDCSCEFCVYFMRLEIISDRLSVFEFVAASHDEKSHPRTSASPKD
ncbi:hypothetical protein BpHYR1_032509 [Brachionus plicatilis]|uniref:Uncharacterized protein n=1 Tax=Brachionus plicatilis TaxID=10195 RepID=A0A3M7Q5E6_BRAPC|nr:hypothetical protein BpHYR1_032509 [Brachionus plicatilis]